MPSTPNIANNLKQVRDQIKQLEEAYGRPIGSVRLLAVSKKKPLELIREAAESNQDCFGENYAEEGANKRQVLEGLNLEWHYIGHIQSNKTRLISANYDWVQSIDREKIAQRLAAHRPADKEVLNVCLQVNIDGETSKSGCNPTDLTELANKVAAMDRLKLRGIMAIPAPQADFNAQRSVFRRLYDLYEKLRADHATVDTLSMGMSTDIEAAIAEGATMVRIGTAIFGQRD